MTFDLDPSAAAARDRARHAATALTAAAVSLDADGIIPPTVAQLAQASLPPPSERLGWVLAVEELAVVSGSLAVEAALSGRRATSSAGAHAWMGLRGVDLDAARAHANDELGTLGVAAVLVGLARAALETALTSIRTAGSETSRPEQQHWTAADAATELDAARLLLWRAALAPGQPAPVAMARMQARAAAEAVVSAARRVLGADSGPPGATLDRIARDVATTTLVFGGPDREEAAVADAVLPPR
jgi:hypothetical protein